MVERLLDVWLSVQAAEKLGEIAIARLRRRSLEGAAERGGDPGLRRSGVHANDSAVHRAQVRRRNDSLFQLHRRCKRLVAYRSFVGFGGETVKKAQ